MLNVMRYIVLGGAIVHTLGYSLGIVLLNDMLAHRDEYDVPGSGVMYALDSTRYLFIALALMNACGIVGLVNTRGDYAYARCFRFQLWTAVFKYYVVGSAIEMFVPALVVGWINVNVHRYGPEYVTRAACLQVPGFDVWFRWDVDACGAALAHLQRLDGAFATVLSVAFFVKFAFAAASWFIWKRMHSRKALFIDTSAGILAKEEPQATSPASFGTPSSLSEMRLVYDSPLSSPAADPLPYSPKSPKRRGSRIVSLTDALPHMRFGSPSENADILPTHNAAARHRGSSLNNGDPLSLQEGSGSPSVPRFVTRTKRSMSMPNAGGAFAPRSRQASRDLPDLEEKA